MSHYDGDDTGGRDRGPITPRPVTNTSDVVTNARDIAAEQARVPIDERTAQTTDHLAEAHAAALSAFQREDKRLAPGGGALDSELVAAAVDAARPHHATYYKDKGRKAGEEHVGAEAIRLSEELAEARFRPMGDNHPNAAACPYCSPEHAESGQKLRAFKAERDAAEDKGRSEERERLEIRVASVRGRLQRTAEEIRGTAGQEGTADLLEGIDAELLAVLDPVSE